MTLELYVRSFMHVEFCEELNRLGYQTRSRKSWRPQQQLIKLLQSFVSDA
jgi:hypothetical protein